VRARTADADGLLLQGPGQVGAVRVVGRVGADGRWIQGDCRLRETHHDSERRLGASVCTQPTLALPHAPHAASTRADKLRKRLGWEAGILNGD
jgi:hypothetical protein